jgi:hypothetical protein
MRRQVGDESLERTYQWLCPQPPGGDGSAHPVEWLAHTAAIPMTTYRRNHSREHFD